MRIRWVIIIAVALVIIYLAGPSPVGSAYPLTMPQLPATPSELDAYVSKEEHAHHTKPDNEARIVWANDSIREQTEYSIVYLHGFSSSQAEGDPVHLHTACEFGCNLYLSRLADHGLDTTDALINFSVDKYWESAKQALAVGKRLGKKVIIMATSAGGALALKLAAEFPGDVYALVLLSPCIAINDPSAWLLNNHWGLKIARLVVGSDYIDSKDERPLNKQYWYTHYRLEGAGALEEFLETTMTSAIFRKVTQPTQLLYYFKDQIHQDSVVKVDAMLKMYDLLGTPANFKRKQAMPLTGNHVIGSYIRSNDTNGVERQVDSFMTDVLHIARSNKTSCEDRIIR